MPRGPFCAEIGVTHNTALHNATAPTRMEYLRIIIIFMRCSPYVKLTEIDGFTSFDGQVYRNTRPFRYKLFADCNARVALAIGPKKPESLGPQNNPQNNRAN
jgi:hypothetical protein